MSDYVPGAWNAICSMCGWEFKNFELRKHWQGQWRCSKCWEPRHPQDFVRSISQERAPEWTQQSLESPWTNAVCTPNGQTSIAGFSVAGCWIAGFTHPFFDSSVTE